MRLCPALLLAFALAGPLVRAASRTPHDDFRDRVLFQLGRTKPVTNAARLRERLKPRDEGALLVTGSPRPEVLIAARRLARTLCATHGYRLFLIQQFENENTPVFEGLVLAADDTIVANFVLKTRARGDSSPVLPTDHALPIQIMRHYRLVRWADRLFVDTPLDPSNYDSVLTDSASRVKFVADLAATFGAETERPTWIFFDAATEDRPPASFVDDALLVTAKFSRIRRVSLVLKDTIVSAVDKRVRTEALVAERVDQKDPARAAAVARPQLANLFKRAGRGRLGLTGIDLSRAHDLPGLIMAGAVPTHRRNTVAGFAQSLFRRHGLTLYLITDDRGAAAPGIDGLVLDADRRVIANFVFPDRDDMSDASDLTTVARTAAQFRSAAAWIDHLAERPDILTKDRLNPALTDRLDFLSRLAVLYALGTDRPTWLLVGAGSIRDPHDGVKIAAARATTGPDAVDVILIRTRRKLLTAHGGRAHEEPWGACEQDFTEGAVGLDLELESNT